MLSVQKVLTTQTGVTRSSVVISDALWDFYGVRFMSSGKYNDFWILNSLRWNGSWMFQQESGFVSNIHTRSILSAFAILKRLWESEIIKGARRYFPKMFSAILFHNSYWLNKEYIKTEESLATCFITRHHYHHHVK